MCYFNFIFFGLYFMTALFPPIGADEVKLVDIQKVNPRIKVHNTRFCPCPQVYLVEGVAYRLGCVQQELEKDGMGLIVYKGYRSPWMQWMMDSCFSGDTYPEHYRKGMGVDVSIYYLSGLPLQVPSTYGDCSGQACRDNCRWPCHVFHNISVLDMAMWRHGFEPMHENWWHYDARGWKKAPMLSHEYME